MQGLARRIDDGPADHEWERLHLPHYENRHRQSKKRGGEESGAVVGFMRGRATSSGSITAAAGGSSS
jgi:hypothetical protein